MSAGDLGRRVPRRERRAVRESPAPPLPEADLWALLAAHPVEVDAGEALASALAARGVDDACAFHERVARLLWLLDGPAYAGAGELSPDGFLYRRSFAVRQGEAHLGELLARPRVLPDAWCQALTAVATLAAERLCDDEPVWIPTSVSYETYSNREAWVAAGGPPARARVAPPPSPPGTLAPGALGVGARVRHPVHGPGTVLFVRADFPRARVEFADGEHKVEVTELEVE